MVVVFVFIIIKHLLFCTTESTCCCSGHSAEAKNEYEQQGEAIRKDNFNIKYESAEITHHHLYLEEGNCCDHEHEQYFETNRYDHDPAKNLYDYYHTEYTDCEDVEDNECVLYHSV